MGDREGGTVQSGLAGLGAGESYNAFEGKKNPPRGRRREPRYGEKKVFWKLPDGTITRGTAHANNALTAWITGTQTVPKTIRVDGESVDFDEYAKEWGDEAGSITLATRDEANSYFEKQELEEMKQKQRERALSY